MKRCNSNVALSSVTHDKLPDMIHLSPAALHQSSVEEKASFRTLLYPVIISALLWIIKSLFIILTPLRALAMTPWLIDDSFIIMRISRNFALGLGYSYDGIHMTSGAPVLWTLMTSVNHFFLNEILAAKATMIESALFAALSTILVFFIAYRLFNLTVAWAAFCLSVASSPMFFNSLNGMETSLFTCLGLLAVIIYLHIEYTICERRFLYILLGGVLGLLHLTRIDGVFLSFVLLLLCSRKIFSTTGETRKHFVMNLGLLIVCMGLITAPAILWSFYITGSPMPANQAGRRFLAWEAVVIQDGTILWSRYLQQIVQNTRLFIFLVSITTGSAVLALVSVSFGLFQKNSMVLSRLIFLYLGMYGGTLILYQGYFFDVHGLRYLNLVGHLFSITLAAFGYYAFSRVYRQKLRAVPYILATFITLLIALSFFQYQHLVSRLTWTGSLHTIPLYTEREIQEWWDFLDWVNANIPDGTAIAVKDHGRLAYFTDVRVVDLAGIIDPSLMQFIQTNNVTDYFLENQVEYVIAPPQDGQLVYRLIRKHINLEEVVVAPSQEGVNYRLYRVIY
jgi:hypothetical protein